MQHEKASQHKGRRCDQPITFPGVIKPFSSASDIMLIPILKHNRLGARLVAQSNKVQGKKLNRGEEV
jgi:hypothetical protein